MMTDTVCFWCKAIMPRDPDTSSQPWVSPHSTWCPFYRRPPRPETDLRKIMEKPDDKR